MGCDARGVVRSLVLNEICDDFENIDQVILTWVKATGAKCGMMIERSEVVQALESLIADGLAKAYILRLHLVAVG